MKRGFLNWYDFLSCHFNSPQKMQKKKGEQISGQFFWTFLIENMTILAVFACECTFSTMLGKRT